MSDLSNDSPQSDPSSNRVETDREILQAAHAQGGGATLAAWIRLSGPGWLQSAITLGGGSLAGALFLGILGGTSLLWLQLMAITMGVVMLSAISYVTLSTGRKPFNEINQHINPVLGWGWILATVAANMIFCMPQFSLAYAALSKNLLPTVVTNDTPSKVGVSIVLLAAAGILTYMNTQRGMAAMVFDILLKAMIGIIVICFFGVVVKLSFSPEFNWGEVLSGFIPDIRAVNAPTGKLAELVMEVPEAHRSYWETLIVQEQRAAMIGAAATAVGINMTFLLPYSMLARGWDRPFRGMARFDLATGMAIPYILVTSCVVIASASAFHAQADPQLLSNDPAEMKLSPVYAGAEKMLAKRVNLDEEAELAGDQLAMSIAGLPDSEKILATALVRRDAFALSNSLSPLLGETLANYIFGIGVFGMGFSTIIILMMINGYAFTEMVGGKPNGTAHVIGCIVAGISGAMWFTLWDGESKVWLAILVSGFAVLLLPIAYVTFFMMMNSRRILGDDKPKGIGGIVWNVLMFVSVVGAIAAACTSLYDKVSQAGGFAKMFNSLSQYVQGAAPPEAIPSVVTGILIIGIAIYLILVAVGFSFVSKETPADDEGSSA